MGLSQGAVRVGFQGMALKAWVKFNGTTGAIDSQFNVASVVRSAVGTYTLTFTQALATARYFSPTAATGYNKTITGTPIEVQMSGSTTASSTVNTKDATGTAVDCPIVYFEVYE